ncbi:MAG: arsenate reductase ArsC [Bacteroidales bacterium]|nr:arsenate reductase ArsC [Bacteroidales bacterium]
MVTSKATGNTLQEPSKIKVLFLCVHNSARSQMAEAFLNQLGGDIFIAESAGLEPGILNPFVIEVMQESGIDISDNQTRSAFDLFKLGRIFHYVITVCDAANAERCPVFPGVTKRIAWSFEDPSSFTGTYDEKLAKTRQVRDNIRLAIEELVNDHRKAIG